MHNGDVVVYGVLFSIDYPESPSFLRHQYPSQLPEAVQQRLRDVSRRVITRVGLDSRRSPSSSSTTPVRRRHLLEINPRHSQSPSCSGSSTAASTTRWCSWGSGALPNSSGEGRTTSRPSGTTAGSPMRWCPRYRARRTSNACGELDGVEVDVIAQEGRWLSSCRAGQLQLRARPRVRRRRDGRTGGQVRAVSKACPSSSPPEERVEVGAPRGHSRPMTSPWTTSGSPCRTARLAAESGVGGFRPDTRANLLSTSRTANGTSRRSGIRSTIRIGGARLRVCVWTSGGRASRKACSPTVPGQGSGTPRTCSRGWRRGRGARVSSACSASRGVRSPRCRWRRGDHRICGPSPSRRSPTIGTPTISITWAVACCRTTSPSPGRCWPTAPCHRIRRWWGSGGGRCGANASTPAGRGWRRGCIINAGTATGPTRRSRRTTPMCGVPCWPRVAGPTGIRTRWCGC